MLGASALASGAGVLFADPQAVALFTSGERLLLPAAAIVLGYPVETLATIAAALLGTAWGLYRYPGPLERALLWVVAFVVVAMHPALPGDGPALFLMAAGVVLTIGMVETSYVLAFQDELTGLPGRRALMQYLGDIQGRYALAMVDVDHFKKFNDSYGHSVGDQVLRLVARAVRERLRQKDLPARYGGEELIAILPQADLETCAAIAERIRSSIAECQFTRRSTGEILPRITVSIGVGQFQLGESMSDVIDRCDRALYLAKKFGRNRVVTELELDRKLAVG